MPDLATLSPDREALKNAVTTAYPDKKPGAIPNNAGQLFRFTHEMNIGALVVFPNKTDRSISVGKVTGDYAYQGSGNNGYPHQRSVKWLKRFERTQFSQGALYEIGSAMSFFQVKNYADEFHAALEGKSAPPNISEDESALYGKLSDGEYGLFVTLGKYSRQCRDFEQGKGNLRLIEGDELVDLIFQHYESFDTRYKSLLPLKRIYVPEVINDSDQD